MYDLLSKLPEMRPLMDSLKAPSNVIIPIENSSCVINILDISANLTPFFSLSLPPSNKPNSIALSPLSLRYLIWLCYLFFSRCTQQALCISWKINNIAKETTLPILVIDRWNLASSDGGKDDEYNGIDFMEISKIFVMQHTDFFGTISVDWLQYTTRFVAADRRLLADPLPQGWTFPVLIPDSALRE